MAGSVNKVILVGNLGRDPEVRYTQNNQKIVHLSVATSERWKDRQSGEPRERTEWLPCLPIEAPDPLAVALGGSETAGLQLAAELAGLQLAPTCDPKAPAPPTS